MSGATVNLAPRFLPARLPRLCVPVWATKPALGLPKLKTFVEYHPEALIIATCRRAVNGGKFRGSAAAQIDVLTKAANQGCHLVDIELETASRLKPADFARLRQSAN